MERHSGTVVSFNSLRGWGYIHTPSLLEVYGKDVFLHRDYLDGECQVGDVVSFEVEHRKDGMPQARSIVVETQEQSAPKVARVRPGRPADSQRFSGTIASFNEEKGCGYIHSPTLSARYGRDVFLHRNHVEEECQIGDTVTFAIELRGDGMPQARSIRAQAPEESCDALGRHSGVIVRFNPDKGWGHIHSEALFAEYGKDVFLHRTHMEEECGTGDTVSFEMELGKNGMPQARSIRLESGEIGSARPIGGKPSHASIGGKPSHASIGGKPSRASGDQSARHWGTIATFNAQRGWGYIHSPELLAWFGKDVFLHRDYIEEDFQLGDTVSFAIELRKDGMPQARSIRSQSKGQGGKGGSGPNGGRHTGVVASFNAEKGWGYIHSPALLEMYGKDVFLHRSYAEREFSVGETVSFSIELRKDGMPQARDIKASRKRKLDGRSPGPESWRSSGIVASFNPHKGWGYIHSPELLAQYGKDVFLHRDYMQGPVSVGDTVTFVIELRKDGMPQARDIAAQSW